VNDAAYAIGVDFGTESGRVLLLELESGAEVAVHAVPYASAVIDRKLPGSGERLGHDWALQDPDDWLAVLEQGIPAVLQQAGAPSEQVVGIGIDFTSCTVLPVDADGTPLCLHEPLRGRPHAWPKLWKHHAAQPVADRLTEVAGERGEAFLARYGGRISSEWYFPKLIEVWREDREVYDEMAAFVEATDWIVWHLTGHECRQLCAAGYKAFYDPQAGGIPGADYFEAAYPGFDDPQAKLGHEFVELGTRAGSLRSEMADRLGLPAEVAVAVGNVDSFVSVPGAGVREPGAFVSVVGTSICDMVLAEEEVLLPGITGVVRDGILPGLYGYEAGQVAVGDMLAWYLRELLRERSYEELEREAAALAPGQTGLIAFDWWNGNRSILADADLTGVIFGLTLQTRAQDIYRALLESIAFANRRIVENFTEHGVAITEIVACGGIAVRSPLTMQLFADVSGLRVRVPDSDEIPARGAALFGAVAAGYYEDIFAAIEATKPGDRRVYEPDLEAKAVYDRVYAIYRELYGRLGSEHSALLHDLKHIRTSERT
jgi:L-ribulokinase